MTARDFAQTVELAQLQASSRSSSAATAAAAGRQGGRPPRRACAALARWARGRRFDAALAHGSTDQPMVARALRHPGDDDVRLRVRRRSSTR